MCWLLNCPPPIHQVLEVIAWEGDDKRQPRHVWIQNIYEEVFILGDVEAPRGCFVDCEGSRSIMSCDSG